MPVVPTLEGRSALPTGTSGLAYQTGAGATPDAFGASVGQAVSGLGREIDRSGDMLARHALFLQGQANEAKSNTAIADYDIQSANVYNEFKNLQGSIPQEKMPEYMKKLEELRSGMRDGLPNPEVARQFDQATRRQFAYTIKEMAGHAAQQNKVYQKAASAGKVAANGQAALINPTDDAYFAGKLAEARATLENDEETKGFEGPAKEQHILRQLSRTFWEPRLMVLAQEDPQAAWRLFEKNKDKIAAEQIPNLYSRITNGLVATESRKIADQSVNGGGGFEALLRKRESGGSPSVQNSLGYTGLYQFGAPRLADIGVYRKGEGENLGRTWSGAKWSGVFDIPGFPEVKTIEDFKNNPAAQKKAFDLHVAKMDQEIEDNGLEKYIGTQVKGVNITRAGLYNMIHLGGAGGAKEALTGGSNRADANGTTVMDYAKMGEGVGDAGLTVDGGPNQLKTVLDAAKSRVDAANVPEELRPRLMEVTTTRVKAQHATINAQAREAKNENWSKIQGILTAGPDGPKSYEDFKNSDPNAEALYNTLGPADQKRIQNLFVKNSKADWPRTEENEREYYQWLGKSTKTASPEDRQATASEDFASKEWPYAMRKDMAQRQAKIKSDSEGEAHLNRFLGFANVKAILTNSHLRPGGNKKQWEEFTGRALEQLELINAQTKGKVMNEAEARDLASGLVRTVVTSPGVLWDTKETQFKVPPTDTFKTEFGDRWMARTGARPDEQTIRKYWLQKQMLENKGKQ